VWIALVAAGAWANVNLNGCSSSSPQGGEGQSCFPNDTCNAGLTCASKRCVKLPTGAGGAAGTSTAGSSGAGGSTAGAGGAGGAAAGAGGSTAGAGGAAAGAGGAAAGAGGAAAGAGGATAGAGGATAGSGGATAGSGGATAGAGGALNCNVTATYGPVTFAAGAQQAVAYQDNAKSAAPAEVDWDATLNNDAKPDVLGISMANLVPPFTNGIVPMNTIDLTGMADYRNCGACVVIIAHADPAISNLLASGDDYIATSGTLKLTATPSFPLGASSRITGTLTNVVFKHVKINPTTLVTSDVDGCKITLSSANFDSVVTPGM
jgi:hypothetical protein